MNVRYGTTADSSINRSANEYQRSTDRLLTNLGIHGEKYLANGSMFSN